MTFTMSHPLLVWIVIGLVAGWLAGTLSRGRGFGCIANLVLGLIGALLGGWLFGKLGIFGGGFLYTLAAATVGAVVLVLIAGLFSGNKS
ncbi:MAG: GlsB/YeaQ/YmgE family stress response membrane protein [Candidatus Acidiferrales bacterium]